MKKCVPSGSGRILTVLAIAACGIASVFAFRELARGNRPPWVFLAMGLFFGCAALRLLWLAVSKGCRGFFYDEERILFVLSRKDRREYRWEELPEAGVTFLYPTVFCPNGTFFFSGKPKGWQMVVTPQMTGYKEFLAMVRKKEVPAPAGIPLEGTGPDVGEIFDRVFDGQFGGKDEKRK